MKQLLQSYHADRGHGDDDEARRVVMGRWRSALGSGLRTTLACTVVGLISLYAPPMFRRHITFPAFSYVVTVIIVTDATLGTALHGAVSAIHATLMGAAPSVLALWFAHRTGTSESVLATSAVVALMTFAVALPESVGPVAKRIALGQIIIIYVAMFQQGERPTLAFTLQHPANVVACTVIGVVAALLAMLVPWPRLATHEAREKRRAYQVLAAKRTRVMVDTFCYLEKERASCRQRWCRAACMSEVERLASASNALLHRINSIREDVQWERALQKACQWAQAADLDTEMMETHFMGMKMALTMIRVDAKQADDNICDLVMRIKDQTCLALLTPYSSKQSIRLRLSGKELLSSTMLSRGYEQQLAPFLFLFSLSNLQCRGTTTSSVAIISNSDSKAKQVAQAEGAGQHQQATPRRRSQEKEQQPPPKASSSIMGTMTKHCRNILSWPRLLTSAKCGFSLGLAVLLGLLFSNDHGFWSGLIVATTMTARRDSTWALGIARAHGTAIGSVYGVLGCLLISQRQLLTMDLRFLALLPWMVLATFLKRSRAYGSAGGVAAALSAIIIVGRRYDEPPMAFTISRLVETFIGIFCIILADLIFQPGGRPSVQARAQLISCIATLVDYFDDDASDNPHQMLMTRVQQQLALLRRCMIEARNEPTYLWLPPFPTCVYGKIESSLSRMGSLLHLFLNAQAEETLNLVDLDVVDFNRVVSTVLNHCLLLAANSPLSIQDETSYGNDDLEAGHGTKCTTSCNYCDEEVIVTPEEVVGSFLARARQTLVKEDGEEAEGLEICCLATMGLCMAEIMKEALRLEGHILDLSLQHR